jgi:hypothetical protein
VDPAPPLLLLGLFLFVSISPLWSAPPPTLFIRYPCEFQNFATSGDKLVALFESKKWALVKAMEGGKTRERNVPQGKVDWIPHGANITTGEPTDTSRNISVAVLETYVKFAEPTLLLYTL